MLKSLSLRAAALSAEFPLLLTYICRPDCLRFDRIVSFSRACASEQTQIFTHPLAQCAQGKRSVIGVPALRQGEILFLVIFVSYIFFFRFSSFSVLCFLSLFHSLSFIHFHFLLKHYFSLLLEPLILEYLLSLFLKLETLYADKRYSRRKYFTPQLFCFSHPKRYWLTRQCGRWNFYKQN